MKKVLVLLFILISQLCLAMDTNMGNTNAGQKRKKSTESTRPLKKQKQKEDTELQIFPKCTLKYLEDGSECGQELLTNNKSYQNHKYYEQHIIRNADKCPGCNTKFKPFTKLMEHLSTCDKQAAIELSEKIKKAELPQRCNGCGKIFAHSTSIIKKHKCTGKPQGYVPSNLRHQEQAQPEELRTLVSVATKKHFSKCTNKYLEDASECGQELFTSKSVHRSHISSEQHVTRDKKCPGCQEKFPYLDDFIGHLSRCESQSAKELLRKINEADIPQKCKDCGKLFSYSWDVTGKHKKENLCKGKQSGLAAVVGVRAPAALPQAVSSATISSNDLKNFYKENQPEQYYLDEFFIAIYVGSIDRLQFLRDKVDINKKDRFNNTVLEVAKRFDRPEIVNYLISLGAK